MGGAGDGINKGDAPLSKRKQRHSHGQEITARTIKTPPFAYACVDLITASASENSLDELTARSYITSALTQFLGLTGSAISIDVLKVEGGDCWIRMPREDLSIVTAALGGWVGGNETDGKVAWRVKASGNWLSLVVGRRRLENIWKH